MVPIPFRLPSVILNLTSRPHCWKLSTFCRITRLLHSSCSTFALHHTGVVIQCDRCKLLITLIPGLFTALCASSRTDFCGMSERISPHHGLLFPSFSTKYSATNACNYLIFNVLRIDLYAFIHSFTR